MCLWNTYIFTYIYIYGTAPTKIWKDSAAWYRHVSVLVCYTPSLMDGPLGPDSNKKEADACLDAMLVLATISNTTADALLY